MKNHLDKDKVNADPDDLELHFRAGLIVQVIVIQVIILFVIDVNACTLVYVMNVSYWSVVSS